MNFTNKKIIVILASVVLVLLSLILIIQARRKTVTDNQQQMGITPSPGQEIIPTGILIPKDSIPSGELDIIDIFPKDQSINVTLDQKIEITFSRDVKPEEIAFYIGPTVEFNQQINGNKLIVQPLAKLESGTLYTFSLDFTDDKQKIRVYTFTTSGHAQQFLPDTGPSEDFIKRQERLEKENDPDIYVTNHTPYQTPTFSVRAEFVPQVPAHFKFIVTLKNQSRGKADFNVWLQTMDLTQQQIDSFDVQYN